MDLKQRAFIKSNKHQINQSSIHVFYWFINSSVRNNFKIFNVVNQISTSKPSSSCDTVDTDWSWKTDQPQISDIFGLPSPSAAFVSWKCVFFPDFFSWSTLKNAHNAVSAENNCFSHRSRWSWPGNNPTEDVSQKLLAQVKL